MPDTCSATTPPDSILEAVPDSLVIRRRLAELSRERVLLRSLLRVAERREEHLRQCARGGNPRAS